MPWTTNTLLVSRFVGNIPARSACNVTEGEIGTADRGSAERGSGDGKSSAVASTSAAEGKLLCTSGEDGVGITGKDLDERDCVCRVYENRESDCVQQFNTRAAEASVPESIMTLALFQLVSRTKPAKGDTTAESCSVKVSAI